MIGATDARCEGELAHDSVHDAGELGRGGDPGISAAEDAQGRGMLSAIAGVLVARARLRRGAGVLVRELGRGAEPPRAPAHLGPHARAGQGQASDRRFCSATRFNPRERLAIDVRRVR